MTKHKLNLPTTNWQTRKAININHLTDFPCNDQRTTTYNTLETWLNRKRGVTIRKKQVIDLTMREVEILYQALGRYLGKRDYRQEVIDKEL